MTQDAYTLFKKSTLGLSDDEWVILVEIAKSRLASFLCLESLPCPIPHDLKLLLANFIFAMEQNLGAGTEKVASKSVRNFTVSFVNSTADTIFAKVASDYADIIAKYSKCSCGLVVERDWNIGDDRF